MLGQNGTSLIRLNKGANLLITGSQREKGGSDDEENQDGEINRDQWEEEQKVGHVNTTH